MAGWLGGWVAGWLGGWVAGWLGGWVAGWLGGWVVFVFLRFHFLGIAKETTILGLPTTGLLRSNKFLISKAIKHCAFRNPRGRARLVGSARSRKRVPGPAEVTTGGSTPSTPACRRIGRRSRRSRVDARRNLQLMGNQGFPFSKEGCAKGLVNCL